MWWLLLTIPLAFIALILFIKVRLCLVYEDELKIKVKILFLSINLYPKTEKSPNPRDYSLKKLQKRQEKAEKKKIKKKTKNQAAQAPNKNKATQIKDILELIKIVLENVMSPFGKYLKIEIIKIYVKIATDDPAKTAFIYGLASQSVAYIIELISNITNVDVKKKNSIVVSPDFISEKSDAIINITLGLRGWHAFALAVKFFLGYIKSKNKTEQNIKSLNITEE